MSKIRKYLTFANATMTLALVFAMTGGAYAASKYVISSTKQISPKVLKSLQGKVGVNGAAGANGAQGPAGPAGPAGSKGEAGAAGANGVPGEKGVPGERGAAGTDGFNGSNGVSVTSKTVSTGEAACNKEGGSEFTAASKSTTFACDGKEGIAGKEGSPWTDKGTLPVGSSETGQWSFTLDYVSKVSDVSADISFPIQLAGAITEANTHFIGAEEGEGEPHANLPAGCGGNYKEPKAVSGNLCIFARTVYGFGKGGIVPLTESLRPYDAETGEAGAGKSGAYLTGTVLGMTEEEIFATADGDWVVTG
ncbi:MAG: hypothetical protein WBQ21_07380 [Solirubrobacteraceae bacterium]